MYFKYLVFFLLLIIELDGYSQDLFLNEVLEQRIEFLIERSGEESIDLTTLLDNWNFFLEHKINLNQTNELELSQLSLLTPFQINALLNYIQTNGKLLTVYELQAIDFWDLASIERVLPFVEVLDRADVPYLKWSQIKKELKIESISRMNYVFETKKGFEKQNEGGSNVYLGQKFGSYQRFRFKYRNNFSLGFTGASDIGEYTNLKSGFDFNSFHLFFRGGRFIESFVVGDYSIQIGQGLNFWSGYSFGKSSDLLQINKNPVPISPFTSSDESRYLRGSALALKYKRLNFLTFYSNKRIDASTSEVEGDEFIKSLTQTGLHRTITEISRKNQVKESIFGNNLTLKNKWLKIGLTGVYQQYDIPYFKDTLLYNSFDFRGQNVFTSGIDYALSLKKGRFFGECVTSGYGLNSSALLNGFLFALDSKTVVSLLSRFYGRSYYTFYSSGFSEGSKNINENGLLFGLQRKITSKFNLTCYFDYFNSNWLRYNIDQPSDGYDAFIQFDYVANKSHHLLFRFQQQEKQLNLLEKEFKVINSPKSDYRFQYSLKLTDFFELKSRVSVVQSVQSDSISLGYLIFQDFKLSTVKGNLKFISRFAVFNTESYNERIYAYENNLSGVYSVPAYYGKGTRSYFLLKYKIFKGAECSIRYAITNYYDRAKIGSGLEEINGNQKSELLFQFRLRI